MLSIYCIAPVYAETSRNAGNTRITFEMPTEAFKERISAVCNIGKAVKCDDDTIETISKKIMMTVLKLAGYPLHPAIADQVRVMVEHDYYSVVCTDCRFSGGLYHCDPKSCNEDEP